MSRGDLKKYNRHSHSLLSLIFDPLPLNGVNSPCSSPSSETCTLKSSSIDHSNRSSKYHCNCHVIPETDFYLTPLQKKTILLKEMRKEIRDFEKNNKIKDEKIKSLEEQIMELTKQLGNIDKKDSSYEMKKLIEAKSISNLYNKIGNNLAQMKEELDALNDLTTQNTPPLSSQVRSPNGHCTPPPPHSLKSPHSDSHKCRKGPFNVTAPRILDHVITMSQAISSVQKDLAALNTLAQESRDDSALAREMADQLRAEYRARLGFLKDALFHYLINSGSARGSGLDASNVHYKAVCAVIGFSGEQLEALSITR